MPRTDQRTTTPETRDTPPSRVLSSGDPHWQTLDGETCRLWQGDVCERLAVLPEGSVQCVVTSPPYWGLRDYGTGTWVGGNSECEHVPSDEWLHSQTNASSGLAGKSNSTQKAAAIGRWYRADSSCRCGAKRIDMQMGSEPSPDCGTHGQAQCGRCFVCNMVRVFRGVRRVLRDDGTLWLNLGDTYACNAKGNVGSDSYSERPWESKGMYGKTGAGVPLGNLVGVPWRVALALQADGWVLRQDLIWSKPSPMPESVSNRCTKAHEYVFLFAKREGYFCDMAAIREESLTAALPPRKLGKKQAATEYDGMVSHNEDHARAVLDRTADRNRRDVWSIDDHLGLYRWLGALHPELLATYLSLLGEKGDVWRIAGRGTKAAHFAAFGRDLVEPMILAGTSARGACALCGAPWRRILERDQLKRERPNDYVKRVGAEGTGNSCGNTVAGVSLKTVGWRPTCECRGKLVRVKGVKLGYGTWNTHEDDIVVGQRKDEGMEMYGTEPTKEIECSVVEYQSDLPLDEHPVRACVVLDPFCGTATVPYVAILNKRRGWGIDLSADYLNNFAVPRLEGYFQAVPDLRHLVARRPAVRVGF